VGNLKRLFFALNWLLVEDGERDAGGGFVDYDPLKPSPGGSDPGRRGGAYTPLITPRGPGSGSTFAGSSAKDFEPQLYRRPTPGEPPENRAIPIPPTGGYGVTPERVDLFAENLAPVFMFKLGGREYPVRVQQVTHHPLTGRPLAEAYFHGGRRWQRIEDEGALTELARAVGQNGFE
jgi:hypothetical protein